MPSSSIKRKEREPRWTAFVAMLADGLVYLALPERLSVGPSWALLAIIFVLLIPITVTYHRERHDVTKILTFGVNAVITLALVGSLGLLIQGLPSHRDSPATLLRSAGALWITNVLVFALWYWKLDAGGPLGRDLAGRYQGSFLFPQMLLEEEGAESSWSPNFLDYLFLAFNTSTAFSPTDTAVLSRGAKLAMMLQALISLSVVIVLLARAVNIL
ncbi:MAG: hypothetical protein WBS19_13795 [Candidatus Korobacteraceae bacterium]